MGVCACVCHNEKSARRMASTTSDSGDTSSEQQQAQRKENYNKRMCVCLRAFVSIPVCTSVYCESAGVQGTLIKFWVL